MSDAVPLKPRWLSAHLALLAKHHYGPFNTRDVVEKITVLLRKDRLMAFEANVDETGYPNNKMLREVMAQTLVSAIGELYQKDHHNVVLAALTQYAAVHGFVPFVMHVMGMMATLTVFNKDKVLIELPEIDPQIARQINAINELAT
jgi:hypothetical protein